MPPINDSQINWHVDKKACCVYSQLKSCSSSEVAAMMEGVLRHCTEMSVDRNYVDTHGQSAVAFAFSKLLGFELLPRLKAIHAQKLYRPDTGQPDAYPNLQPILTRPINWALIREQYDEIVKYATALRLGTAETEAILRRFTRNNLQHGFPIAAEQFSSLRRARCAQVAPGEGLLAEILVRRGLLNRVSFGLVILVQQLLQGEGDAVQQPAPHQYLSE